MKLTNKQKKDIFGVAFFMALAFLVVILTLNEIL